MQVIIGSLGIGATRIIKGAGGLGNKRTSGEHSNYYTAEVGQTTEKIPED